jgi:DNA-binding transcriptional regulator YbjK
MSAEEDSGRRGRGPTDPARRQKIANAAIAVVAERGVEGVTHRAVAAAAGVPLGSTTYHFATLDDLLVVALHTAAEHNVTRVREWAHELSPDADLAAALADLVGAGLTEERAQTVVEYELYVAALHRPSLRRASMGWDDALVELFASRTDDVTGRLLAATFCGLVMQALLADPPPTRDEVDAIFRRILRDTPPGAQRVSGQELSP